MSVVPSISAVSYAEGISGLNEQFGAYVQSKSKLSITITAAGAQGSSISSYRTMIGGTTYTGASFMSNTLNTAGTNTMTITVTDSRGRTATTTRSISVTAYTPPTIGSLSAARCDAAGTSTQTDGTRAWISFTAAAASVGAHNSMGCTVFYKLKSAATWTVATTIAHTNYAISKTNFALPASIAFDTLNSYDIGVTVSDYFSSISSVTGLGTKEVIMDFLSDGTGVAFGKVATLANAVEIDEDMAFYAGGKDLSNLNAATIGAVPLAGGTMTGNLTIQGSLYPSVYLQPTYNNTSNRTVFEGSVRPDRTLLSAD